MLSTLANLLFGDEGDASESDDGQQPRKKTRTSVRHGQGPVEKSPRGGSKSGAAASSSKGGAEDMTSANSGAHKGSLASKSSSGAGSYKADNGVSRNATLLKSNKLQNVKGTNSKSATKNGNNTSDDSSNNNNSNKGDANEDGDKPASTSSGSVRKRGRPKGSYKKVNKKVQYNFQHSYSYESFSNPNSTYDFSDYDSFDKERRYSIRSKPIDPSKEIVVIVPSDDPVERLNLAPHEVEEYLALVNDPGGIFLETSPSHSSSNLESMGHAASSSSSSAEIFTPGVAPFKFNSSSKSDSTKGTSAGTTPVVVSFCDYEADSDDDSFLSEECTYKQLFKQVVDGISAKQRAVKVPPNYDRSKAFSDFKAQSFVSVLFFEQLLECLERELETSRKSLPLKLEIEELVSAGSLALKAAEKFMSLCDQNDGNSRKFEQLQKTVNTLRESSVKAPAGFETLKQICTTELTTASVKNDAILTTNESLVSAAEAAVAVSFLAPENNKNNKRKWSAYYADAARETTSKLDTLLYPEYSVKQLRILVPPERIIQIFLYAKDTSLSNDYTKVVPLVFPQMSNEEDLNSVREMMITNVYEYWLEKRTSRKVSLLRCYHNFIMENWQQQRVGCIPNFPEDTSKEGLLEAMKKMLRLRHDLDRSRLIIDRIRRREKIKRDILRLQSIPSDQLVEGQTSRSSVNNNVFLARRDIMEDDEEEEEVAEEEQQSRDAE